MNSRITVFKAIYYTCALASIGTLLALSGCASEEKVEAKSYSVPLRLHAGANLNQGNHKQPLAQVIKIYHLRAIERFEQTPFNSLLSTEEEEKALGTDLLDSRELLLVPNQHYETQENVSAEVQYIAVVAFFRQPAPRRWRVAYSTKDSETTGITLGIHACALTSTQGALVSNVPGNADSLVSVRCDRADGKQDQ
ncbi:type VI secretion system lipoprotein TssJ [Pseudomonas putida]|uniref:type VI secretion system lipoprotein TssJ n=1 Tax=Pseudomonas putida TaxID=303 RepID=UPI0023633C08|nr:type VI secretion system lipoprotein TssJ [Pseudomonas putida]MDD1969115.1 type VI secretion system lipoprotein TssJ [Pseudomonas putida]